MTFPELMIKARYRLHDIRTSQGVIIIDANTDGIRWSSTQLENLCKGAIHELLRSLRGFVAKDKHNRYRKTLNNFINNAVQTRIVSCRIKGATGDVEGLPSKFYKLHRLQAPDFALIYDEVDAETYLSKRWRVWNNDDLDKCPIDERWFAIMTDSNENLVVKSVPIPSQDIDNVTAILTLPLDSFLTKSSTKELPFVDIDDLILDYIEKEASIQENNPQQAKYLMEVITLKMGMILNELQESNR